jgi:hypothetical protein
MLATLESLKKNKQGKEHFVRLIQGCKVVLETVAEHSNKSSLFFCQTAALMDCVTSTSLFLCQ